MAVACGVVLYLPLAVLMQDFLRLWINATFARESAGVGQWLALSFIAPTAFSPIATLFRGNGKPGFVTVVMALAGSVVLVSTLFLVSTHGVLGVGVGYMLSSIAWLGGLFIGWLHWFGPRSLGLLCRVSALPLLLGCGLGLAEVSFHNWLGDLGWAGLIATGGAFAGLNAMVLLGVDRALGGDSPAGYVIEQLLRSERVAALQRRIGFPMRPPIATSQRKSVS
jgi:O-antigen/teichoic acid export membrane protein